MSLFYISKLTNKAKRLQKGLSVQKIPTVYRIENFDDENDITDDETFDRRGRKRKRPSVPSVSILATEEVTDVETKSVPTLFPPKLTPAAKEIKTNERRITRAHPGGVSF